VRLPCPTHWPFHRKLTALVLGLTTAALFLLVAGLLVRESDQLGRQLRSQVATVAQLVAPNVALSLQLGNPEELVELLRTAGAAESLTRGAVYDADGKVVAQLPATGWIPPPRESLRDFEERDGTLQHYRRVPFDQLGGARRLHGGLLLEATTTQVAQRFRALLWQAGYALLLILGALALLSRRLVATVTAPVVELANVAQAVRRSQDYSVRAMRRSGDEVGDLVDSFNDMLAEIQSRDRDAALNAERLELEVERRTEELERTAESLRVAKDKAEASVEARSQFMANVSHEIRTPLNAILGMTDLVLGTELAAEQREYISTVKQSGDALLSIIEEILDFAKIDAGKVELSIETADLRGLISGVLRPLALRAEVKGIDLAAAVGPDVPARISVDPLRLQQVLTNLLGNAIKFTSEGAVTLLVGVSGDRLLFRVRDTGIGIPADRIAQVFEPFVQADGTTSRRYGGTGLGLTISRRLVSAWGGALDATSTVGVGSEFVFDLPLGAEPATPAPPLPPATALLAVDWPAHAATMASVLGSWGLRVVTTSTADVARSLASATRPYDLLIAQRLPAAWDRSAVATRGGRVAAVLLVSPSLLAEAIGCIEAQQLAGYLLWPFDEDGLRRKVEALLGVDASDSERPHAQPSRPAAGCRILVAEDNVVNQRLIRAILGKGGHRFEIAADGLQCVQAFCRGQFDLVLMDMQMPGMDGIEATARIRSLEQQLGHRTPILALTANATAEDRAKCVQAGMDGFLTKPISPERVLAAVAEHAAPAGLPVA